MAAITFDLPDALVEQIAQRAAAILADQAPDVGPRYLTVDEAAEYLRCPKSRIYSLVSARRIPFLKDGSRTLFRADEVDAWLENGGGLRP